MKSIQALSLSPVVNHWLANSHQPRILHVFDHVCNLINERGEVLSVVTPSIGNGPFNIVIGTNDLFTERLNLRSSVSISLPRLIIGNLTFHSADAKCWNPRPDWKLLHSRKDDIAAQLLKLPITNYQFSNSPLSNSLVSSLFSANISSAKTSASQLAGLGQGLTPSGDDFIMGALYAAWIMHPPEIARTLAQEIAEIGVPLTTSLSAAWLRSAGRGEAGILWHEFFAALLLDDALYVPLERILAVGATSGADALAGFMNTFLYDQVKVQYE